MNLKVHTCAYSWNSEDHDGCDAGRAVGLQWNGVSRGRYRKPQDQRMGTVSPAAGFVPRGPHPHGKSYYKDSSLDQHSLYMCGLWRFYRSRIALPEEKVSIRDLVGKVIARLEKVGWAIQVEDGSTKSWEGGSMLVQDGKMPLLLLVDFRRIDLGWAYNYAVLAALWSVAQSQ